MLKFSSLFFGFFGFGLGTLLSTSSQSPKPLQLVQVQVISRHGVRTSTSIKFPSKYKELIQCDSTETTYPNTIILTPTQSILYDEHKKSLREEISEKFSKSCGIGQLTTLGISQMEKLGKLLRKRYVEGLGFLNDEFDGESVSIQSTNYSRTILTAHYIMEGLYPKEKRKNHETIMIKVNPSEEFMYPSRSCKKFSKLKTLYQSNQKLKNAILKVKEILSKVEGDTEEIDFWTTRTLIGSVNDLNTIIDHGLPLPKGLSHSDYESLVKESGTVYKGIHSTDDINRLGIGRLINEIVGNIENGVKQSLTDPSSAKPNPKLLLYSGHDSTLGPLLSALEVFDGKHPRMGSAVIVELWKNTENNFFFQLKYYDPKEGVKELKLPSCNTNLCPLNHLLDKSKHLIPLNYTQECLEDITTDVSLS